MTDGSGEMHEQQQQQQQQQQDNAYLSIVFKKIRNLQKKLRKISEAEESVRSGKTLNNEQLSLLQSKPLLERSLEDLESIKVSLQEVWREEQKAKADLIAIAPVVDTSPTKPTNESQPEKSLHFLEEIGNRVKQILRVFHVANRYEKETKKKIPGELLFFSEHLLGNTSTRSFSDTLDDSVRFAGLLLDVSSLFVISLSLSLVFFFGCLRFRWNQGDIFPLQINVPAPAVLGVVFTPACGTISAAQQTSPT